jgi:hypothetical protein
MYSFLINFGNRSEGDMLVNKNAKINKNSIHLFLGEGCITNQIATPTNAIT